MELRHSRLAVPVLTAVLTLLGCGQPGQHTAEASSTASAPQQFTVNPNGKLKIVAYGDVRFTTPSDHRSSNPEARRAIVQKIAELKPAFVLFTGDLVRRGEQWHDWQVYRNESKPLRDANVRLFTVPGNHELWGDKRLEHYFEQFPELKHERWYTVRAGNTLSLMLDSDVDQKDSPEWQWIDKTLASVPNDIDFVFIALHHPPLTKSSDRMTGGGHSVRPHEAELARMIEQHAATMRQKIIVLAGHVHNYERYERNGVTYIVTGGGGATPYEVPRGPTDFFRERGPNYHFVTFDVAGSVITATMHKLVLQNGTRQWQQKDTFELRAQRANAATSAR